jgi:AcrR family transcriptional regulator
VRAFWPGATVDGEACEFESERRCATADAAARGTDASRRVGGKGGAQRASIREGRAHSRTFAQAAKAVFEEHGFLNARVDDIVARAEQSHGVFYYYFDSKEAVFRAIVAALDERLFAPLDDVLLAESRLARGQRIREASRRYLESFRREARMIDLIEQVSRYDAEVNTLRLAHHKKNTARVAESIRHQQLHGAADPDLDPDIVATALGALTHRFAELWFVHKVVRCTFEQGVEQLSRIYENALRAPPPKKPR